MYIRNSTNIVPVYNIGGAAWIFHTDSSEADSISIEVFPTVCPQIVWSRVLLYHI